MMTMSDMNEGFRERAHRACASCSPIPRPASSSSPRPTGERMDEAVHFHRLLRENRMHPVAVVVNRVHAPPSEQALREAATLSGELGAKLTRTLEEQRALAVADAEGIAKLAGQVGDTPIVQVPRFDLDVHDLDGLYRTSRYLLGERRLGE